MDKAFEKQLQESMYVHFPLKADESKTVEARGIKKTVLHEVPLWSGKSLAGWSFDGEGEARVGDGALQMTTGARADHWPESEVRAVDAESGQYATFGSYVAKLDVTGMDLARCNRLWFQVRPRCPGLHSPIIRAAFVNNGAVKIPDAYSREGFNAINLKNGVWNTCVWEIDSIAHDAVEEVSFTVHRYGKEVSTGDELLFELRDIRLQQVAPDVVRGWQPADGQVVYSTTGYLADGAKTAIAGVTDAARFEVTDVATGAVAFAGPVARVQGRHGTFNVLDFTALDTPGHYRIRLDGFETGAFAIGDDILEEAVWRLVNFLYCERCGCPVPGKHGTCHGDVIAEHDGVKLAFNGGWHDAADVSQQAVQTAEILHAVLQTADSVKGKSPLLYARLMEEANWALDFVLRTRLGDGYRATGAAIRRWTDGLIGNMDDCEVRVHNRSLENFLFSGVEAAAAVAFSESDPELAWKCRQAAAEDFDFAEARFAAEGLAEPFMLEHTASASLSQYYAAACWGAANLCLATGDTQRYAPWVAAYAQRLLACQETGGAAPLEGFFYRDESKQHIVHFSHQARDQIFVQALQAACEALPDDPEKPLWEAGMRLFADYLKALTQYTAPYGMLPAGLYHLSEAEDEKTFAAVHPNVDYGREKANYIEQLKQSIDLGGGYYIKVMPVWFSYRGNSAIHLSMGKAAALLGNYFNDPALTCIAREQLYWTLGKNPFGQSLIYGEGGNYGQQYAALLGETVGEMPVGVQTRGNEDLPYWPPANIATYREVWTTPPGRWLWIAAELMKQGMPPVV